MRELEVALKEGDYTRYFILCDRFGKTPSRELVRNNALAYLESAKHLGADSRKRVSFYSRCVDIDLPASLPPLNSICAESLNDWNYTTLVWASVHHMNPHRVTHDIPLGLIEAGLGRGHPRITTILGEEYFPPDVTINGDDEIRAYESLVNRVWRSKTHWFQLNPMGILFQVYLPDRREVQYSVEKIIRSFKDRDRTPPRSRFFR